VTGCTAAGIRVPRIAQAIASDDTLHSLISGADADAFATHPNLNLVGTRRPPTCRPEPTALVGQA
jgi:hypothetical protein